MSRRGYRVLFMFCFVVNVMLTVWNALHQNAGMLLLNFIGLALCGLGIDLTLG